MRIRISIRNMKENSLKVIFVERFVSTIIRKNRPTAVGTIAYVWRVSVNVFCQGGTA